MADIFVVVSSNCESYEDYSEHIDSVWSDRQSAINHIENALGMKQVDWRSPSRKWSKDRWLKELPELPQREDFDSEEEWADVHDEDGNLIPYWVYYQDAWIEVYPLNNN